MNCIKCGTPVSEADIFCSGCGAKINRQTDSAPGVYCPDCGTEIFNEDAFCPTCGRSLKGRAPAQPYAPQYVQVKPKQSNAGIIIAIIAAIVAFAVAAYAMWKLYPNSGDPAQSEPTQTAEVPPPPPLFPNVSASSTRGYDVDGTTKTTVYYYPYYAVDGDITTAWSSDRNIELTPTITLSADTKQHVSGIRMTNGYCKSEKTYVRNRRITMVKVSYEGGEITTGFDINNYRVMLDIPFDKPVDTRYVSIKVLDSYYGDWKDIAISEIQVY